MTPERVPACTVCQSPDLEPLFEAHDRIWRKPGVFGVVRCPRCTHSLTTPRPPPAAIGAYYEGWYGGARIEDLKRAQADGVVSGLVAAYRRRVLERFAPLKPGMRVLDVGAGFGAQLAHLRKTRGIVPYAIDFDQTVLDHIVEPEHTDVRCGDLLDAGYDADSFDVVCFYEALEHVYDPVATLREAHRILKPGGHVVIEVPCFEAALRTVFGRCWFPLMVPTHLQHFSRASLTAALEVSGFTPCAPPIMMYYPFEVTLSSRLVVDAALGLGAPEQAGPARKWFDLAVLAGLGLVFVLVDVPSQAILWALGRSGHQTAIGCKTPAP